MPQKKTLIGVASFFFIFTLLTGYYALAADAGGRENPLVTVGYLESLDIDAKINEAFDTYLADTKADLDRKIAEVYTQIGDMAGSNGSAGNLGEDPAFIAAVADAVAAKIGSSAGQGASLYEKVTLTAGQTMYMVMGSSFFLRVGSAACVSAGSPGLIDNSVPGELGDGAAIEKNHIYSVTVEGGRGVKNNGTGDVVLFIMGTYTIE